MNPLALELNQSIAAGNPVILEMLSRLGRELFFPKGILSQSAEAKVKAHRINATIGIAKEGGRTMFLDSIMAPIAPIDPADALTYAPAFGLPELRRSWREELLTKNPTLQGKSISMPVVTCGITHSVSLFADMLVDPGDVVLLPDMAWGNYTNIFVLQHGARLSRYALFNARGGFNLEALEQALAKEAQSHNKVIVILNFPQNPTGYTLTRAEGQALQDILVNAAEKGTQVVVALDDAYFGLFYEEPILKESLFAGLSGSHPNLLAVKLDGATKEYFVWGLRVGFITYGAHCGGDSAAVYDALEKKSAGCVRGSISNASHLSQHLIALAMRDPQCQKEKDKKFEILKARAAKVKQVLANSKYAAAFEPYPFNSGYFMCLRLKTVAAEPLRVHLLDKYGVGLIALGERDLRVAFSCIDEAQIPELFDTVLKGIHDLQGA